MEALLYSPSSSSLAYTSTLALLNRLHGSLLNMFSSLSLLFCLALRYIKKKKEQGTMKKEKLKEIQFLKGWQNKSVGRSEDKNEVYPRKENKNAVKWKEAIRKKL